MYLLLLPRNTLHTLLFKHDVGTVEYQYSAINGVRERGPHFK